MFKLICIVLLCKNVLAINTSGACQEKTVDGRTIHHKSGDRWLERADTESSEKRQTASIQYSMQCLEKGGVSKAIPIQCYFEDQAKPAMSQGVYVDPGCMKRFGLWVAKCAWRNDQLEATYYNGGLVEQRKGESEGLQIC